MWLDTHSARQFSQQLSEQSVAVNNFGGFHACSRRGRCITPLPTNVLQGVNVTTRIVLINPMVCSVLDKSNVLAPYQNRHTKTVRTRKEAVYRWIHRNGQSWTHL